MKAKLKEKYGIVVFLMLFLCLSCSQSKQENGKFEQQAIEIADYGLFDLGVADMNNDDWLDIFTANHSAQQSIMLNNGKGGFTDVYEPWKMDQVQDFPGLAIFPDEAESERPGIHVNWVGPDVVVRTRRVEKDQPVQGRIDVFTSVTMIKKENVDVKVTEKVISPFVDHSVIEFSGQGDGFFRFRPYNHALPFQFHIDGDHAPVNIHVGKHHINPNANDFEFQLRDRHGMAWFDFNDDNRMDVFITRGGENGIMGDLPMPFWDELFIGMPDRMEDIGKTAGLAKNGCPGRQAGLIDFNGDNLIDIYVSCGRGFDFFSNMMFQQTTDGHFEDVAAKIGLDIRTDGSSVWLDIDLDHDMDLFWAGPDGHFLYRNEGEKFTPKPLESFYRHYTTPKLTVSDYDNDGDLDIFSASMNGNVLFVNSGGELSPVLPLSVGLPDKSTTANWVDFDNDGKMDLHAAPEGLFIQKNSTTFISSSQLTIPENRFSPFSPVDAIAAWFDVDNNGTRDLLLATRWQAKGRWAKRLVNAMKLDQSFGGLDYYWKAAFYKNQNTDNHWLQVRLTGPPGNRQAIGATVSLQTADWKQMQQVGVSDGSHLSMGHYRLYFGLGQKKEGLTLNVAWPDGKSTQIAQPQVDQLLKIDWQEA